MGWQTTEQSIHPGRLDRLPWGFQLGLMYTWDAVAATTRLVALFPFKEADTVSNRSRKSFVFWQCEVGGAAGCRLVREFQLPVGDWPRRCNGAVSRQCRPHRPPPLIQPPPSSPPLISPLLLLSLLSPNTPLFPGADCHTLFTTAWNVTHNTGYLLEYRSDNWGILLTRAVRVGYLGTSCGDYPSAMTVDLFALLCVLVITSSAMEGKLEIGIMLCCRCGNAPFPRPLCVPLGMIATFCVGQRCASGIGIQGCHTRGSQQTAVVISLFFGAFSPLALLVVTDVTCSVWRIILCLI